MHKCLEENFNHSKFFIENEKKMDLLRGDAESMLDESTTIVHTSGVMAAAILLGKWRIVRDDLPLETPLEIEAERRYKLFAAVLGQYLACRDLEARNVLVRVGDAWEKVNENEPKTIDELICIEQFGEL